MINKQTTVTIDQTTSKKLDKLALTNRLSKKDFIDQALAYFEKYGINPTQDETPVQEMERIRKRQDQIVAFLKTQEKNILEPSLMGMVKAEERMKFEMDKLNSLIGTLTSVKISEDLANQIVKNIQRRIAENQTAIDALEKKISNQIDRQNKFEDRTEKALLEIVKFLDKKDKEGLTGRVKNLFG